jgi:putative tryptophan/tyrosine transport system substrate-binding protein
MMRREFITLLGGAAAAWPLAAGAQEPGRIRRIGVLMGIANDAEGQSRVRPFQQAMQQLGWAEGRNLQVEYRWAAADPKLIQTFAKELIELHPDIIIAATTPVLATMMERTKTIPIVFVSVSDPVPRFVPNYAKPGGNVTGFANFEYTVGEKWLQILKEIAPNVKQVAVFLDPDNPALLRYLSTMEVVARQMGVRVTPTPVQNVAEINLAFEALGRETDVGLILLPTPLATVQHELIISLAAKYRIPAMYTQRVFVVGGGLAAFGTDRNDEFKRAASYVDQILKGESAGNLPIQQPTKFEFTINLKTAKALGLTIAPTTLIRADEVIE